MVNQKVLSRNQTELDLFMPFQGLIFQSPCDEIQGEIIYIGLSEKENRLKPFLVNLSLYPRTSVPFSVAACVPWKCKGARPGGNSSQPAEELQEQGRYQSTDIMGYTPEKDHRPLKCPRNVIRPLNEAAENWFYFD